MLEKMRRLFKRGESDPAIADDLWVLTVTKDNAGTLEEMSPEQFTEFLERQAKQVAAGPQTLYTCDLEGNPVIPLFSSSDDAGTFINDIVKQWKQRSPNISIAAFGVVRMQRAVLFQKILSTPGLVPILDPLTPEKRKLTQADLRRGAQ